MARALTPQDAYAIINALVYQATGQQSITATDTSSFVSAGELILSTGTENVLNSLSLVLNRTLVASRPYKARLDLMEEVNTGLYSSRVRKISYYANDALPSGAFNTDLYTNFDQGYTNGQNTPGSPNSTKSMWEQNPKYPVEVNFAGSSTWQYCITHYEDQLQTAFRSPEDFNAFISGWLTESANDIESEREAWNRMNLLNKIGSVYTNFINGVMPGSVVNLTYEYNQRFNTSFTTTDLLSTYLKEFLAFYVAEIKKYSNLMEHRSTAFHVTPPKTVNGNSLALLRHTPKNRQRLYMYQPLFLESESLVLPEIFHPGFLDINSQYQAVDYWQVFADIMNGGMSVSVTPSIMDVDTTSPTYGEQIAGDPVELNVVALLTDVDGLMTNFQAEIASTTPLESRKLYRNTWTTFLKNNLCDDTENAILFIMADPASPGGSKDDQKEEKTDGE